MRAVFAIPGNINIRNGGFGYNRQMLALLPDFGVNISHMQLPGSLPQGTAEDLQQAAELLAAVPPDCVLLVDSLGFSCLNTDQIAAIRAPIIALVHHPLTAELNLAGEAAADLRAREVHALQQARGVLVSSPFTATQLIEDFAVPAQKLTVALPGTKPALRAIGSGTSSVAMLCVGSLIPRKGYDYLLAALEQLQDLSWHLTIAGSQSLDRPYAQDLMRRIAASPLNSRITLLDEMPAEALDTLYHRADIFLMPSLFEGYGMALAESMARGLPIICTTGGAVSQTVPDAAGLKVPPADAPAFAEAIRVLLRNPGHRARIAQASWEAGQKLPDWPDSAKIVASLVKNASQPC